MIGNRYEIIDAVEDISKLGYSCTYFALKAFYGVTGLDALRNAMDEYMVSRFAQRLEYFAYEHQYFSDEDKKAFYDDLKYNYQNVDYMYELIEKARITTYDFHARILARISADLICYHKLTYFQSSLLANINILTSEDIMKMINFLELHKELEDYDNQITFPINKYEDLLIFQKCMQLGIITDVDTRGMLGFQEKNVLNDKICHLTEFGKEFHTLIDEITGVSI